MDGDKDPCCNVVKFHVRDNLTSELTVRVHQKWFYVQADIKDLRGSSSPKAAKPASSLSKEYQKLARAVLERKQNEEADGRATQLHDDSTSQRDSKDERGACDATDSGYISEDGRAKEAGDSDLQDWLLAPLGEPMAEVFGNGSKSKAGSSKHLTLSEWYRTEVFAFTLQVSPEGELVAVQMNDFNADDFARKHVTHTMALPKYLQHVPQVPWYSPGDIHVLSQSDDIHLPIHPTLVSAPRRVSKQEQKLFLKLATPDTEPSIKREIRLLHELAKRDVHSRGLRAPRLEGLVASPFSPKSRTRILGFLLTLIPQPSTPLTELMSTRIAASKREGWAQETERMVKLLHEHGYIWGDAKADNFIVSGDDEVWMIDFGGSYTPGWIDPELEGTQQGDDQGEQKILDGVRHPEVTGEDHEENESARERVRNTSPHDTRHQRDNKRKRKDSAKQKTAKRRR